MLYTSQDAYNGCLSLYSKEEQLHRGYLLFAVEDVNEKSIRKYKYVPVQYTLETSSLSHPRRLHPRLWNDLEDLPSATEEYCIDKQIFQESKIVVIQDLREFLDLNDLKSCFRSISSEIVTSLWNAGHSWNYCVDVLQSLTLSPQCLLWYQNGHVKEVCFDLSDITIWPALPPPQHVPHVDQALLFPQFHEHFERLSVRSGSLSESWSLCEDGEDNWELVPRLDENPVESQHLNQDGDGSDVPISTVASSRPSYLDIARRNLHENCSDALIHSPHKISAAAKKFTPAVIVIVPVKRSLNEVEEVADDDDECDNTFDYESSKSYGRHGRSTYTAAKISFERKKAMHVPTRCVRGVK